MRCILKNNRMAAPPTPPPNSPRYYSSAVIPRHQGISLKVTSRLVFFSRLANVYRKKKKYESEKKKSNDPLIKSTTTGIVNVPPRQAVRTRLMKSCVNVFESRVCVGHVEMFCVSAKLSSLRLLIFSLLVSRLHLLIYAFLTSAHFLTRRK